jgi:cytochrome P450
MEKQHIEYPPGPKGLPIIGNTIPFARDPDGFLLGNARRYGDVVYYKVGKMDVYNLNHPDYIRDVLVTNGKNFVKGPWTELLKPLLGEGLLTSNGEFHLRQRRLAQPAFHRQRIAGYGEVMTRNAAEVSERWRSDAQVDIAQEMMGLTLNVVAQTLFSGDVSRETRDIGNALTAFLEWWWVLTLPGAAIIRRLPLPLNRRFAEAKRTLDATIYRLIREHRESGKDQGDLLSMLLLAQDTEGDGGGMTDLQVRDEAITIFLAGHETTANALTWAWYLLSQHPEVEATLHDELDEVLGGRVPTAEDIPQLKYTEMVFSETLRLYPPAWTMDRWVLNDFEVGGYKVSAGNVVTTSPYVVHHDPRWYPEPFKFDPMRWTPEEKARRPKFAYFPFGAGGRMCIGEQFAWMEGILILATLTQRWQMRLVPGHKVDTLPRVTLRAKDGMPMRLIKREARPRKQEEVVERVAVT